MTKNSRLCLTCTLYLLASLNTGLIAQEIDQTQISTYDRDSNTLTFPLVNIPGHGLVSDLTIQLTADEGFVDRGGYLLEGWSDLMLLGNEYLLSTAANPDLCIEGAGIDGDSFVSGGCNFTGQLWQIIESTRNSNREDDYFWLQNRSALSDDVCLTDEIVDGNRRVAMQTCDPFSTAQLWKFTPAMNGFFYIENNSTIGFRECLHAEGSDTGRLGLTTCVNSDNQLWWIHEFGEDPEFHGKWNTECDESCGTMYLRQDDTTISGTYAEIGGSGKVSGTYDSSTRTFSGTWERNGAMGGAEFRLSEDGQTFSGNYGGTIPWCGWRDGAEQPANCGP